MQHRRPPQVGGGAGLSPAQVAAGLARFNEAPFTTAEAALLECCGSRRWAHRMAAHRPFPDLPSLLAASDEAGYDLAPRDIAEALAAEPAPSCTTTRPAPPISRSRRPTRRTRADSAIPS